MSNEEKTKDNCPGYQFCMKAMDLQLFDGVDFKVLKEAKVKIIPPEEEKDVR